MYRSELPSRGSASAKLWSPPRPSSQARTAIVLTGNVCYRVLAACLRDHRGGSDKNALRSGSNVSGDGNVFTRQHSNASSKRVNSMIFIKGIHNLGRQLAFFGVSFAFLLLLLLLIDGVRLDVRRDRSICHFCANCENQAVDYAGKRTKLLVTDYV